MVADACIEWDGQCDKLGYGIVKINGKSHRASRAVWISAFGPLRHEQFVCHRCDNPPCVLLSHLFVSTNAGNTADRQAKNRQAKGLAMPQSKLTVETVVEARRLFRAGQTMTSLAARYGVTVGAVSNAIRGKTWGHVTEQTASVSGARHTRLTLDDVALIRRRVAAGERQIDLAQEYGLGWSAIHDIVRRKTFTGH